MLMISNTPSNTSSMPSWSQGNGMKSEKQVAHELDSARLAYISADRSQIERHYEPFALKKLTKFVPRG